MSWPNSVCSKVLEFAFQKKLLVRQVYNICAEGETPASSYQRIFQVAKKDFFITVR